MSLHTPSPPARIAVDETRCAEALSVSVAWLRKDRRTSRTIPFSRLGRRVLYDLDRVRAVLASLEVRP